MEQNINELKFYFKAMMIEAKTEEEKEMYERFLQNLAEMKFVVKTNENN